MFLSAFTANTSRITALQYIAKNKTDERDRKRRRLQATELESDNPLFLYYHCLTVNSYQLSVWLQDQEPYTLWEEYYSVLLNISSHICKDSIEKGMEITTEHCIFQSSKLYKSLQKNALCHHKILQPLFLLLFCSIALNKPKLALEHRKTDEQSAKCFLS